MVKTIIFEDKIILYQDKQWELASTVDYVLTLNGKKALKTTKTHFELEDYTPKIWSRFEGKGNQIKGLTLKNIFVQSRPDGKNQKILIKNVKDLVIEDVDFE